MPTVLVRKPVEIRRRLWLVFFHEAEGAPWWSRFLQPGYRHVSAAAWFDDQERWVYVNPARTGTVIHLYREDEFDGRLGQLMEDSALVLRIPSIEARRSTPFGWWCTGAIKALLGVRGGALSPWRLSRHLLRHGAETVPIPRARSDDGKPVQA